MASIPSANLFVDHDWIDARQLVTREMGEIDQIQCRRCGRDFILISSTGAIQAVDVRTLSFWTLPFEVTKRWLSRVPGRAPRERR